MKILQLSKKNPFPAIDGESIAVHSLSGTFAKLGIDITLLIISTPKHPINVSQIPEKDNFYRQIIPIQVDTEVKYLDAFLNLFSDKSYNISRFENESVKSSLIALLKAESFDIIQLETLYLTPYLETIRQHGRAKIVLRSHNIEYEIWERVAKQQPNSFKKAYLNFLAKRLKRYELAHINKYDMIWAISDRDHQHYLEAGCEIPIYTIPIGINTANYLPIQAFQAKIGFIGSLDWLPNIEGIDWFLQNTWDSVTAQMPAANFYIAGRNTPNRLKQHQQKGVYILGEVPNALDFLRNYGCIMIVPLLSGGGMRVKILEGMAIGCCVITTTIGLEGIPATHQKEVLVADTPQEMVQMISYCLNNLGMAAEIGKRARLFISNTFDNRAIAALAIETINKI